MIQEGPASGYDPRPERKRDSAGTKRQQRRIEKLQRQLRDILGDNMELTGALELSEEAEKRAKRLQSELEQARKALAEGREDGPVGLSPEGYGVAGAAVAAAAASWLGYGWGVTLLAAAGGYAAGMGAGKAGVLP